MKTYTFEQSTPEWYATRLGKLTASKAKTIAVGGKGLDTLCFDCAAEILTLSKANTFSTAATEQGKELEPQARFAFEAKTGLTVEEVGFCEENEFVGCSPDGLVGDDVVVEIKCVQDNTFVKYLYTREINEEHFYQMQMQMLITSRTKAYYVVYNPNFENSLDITEVPADTAAQEKIRLGLIKGTEKINDILATINR